MLFAKDKVLLTWDWLLVSPDNRGAVQRSKLLEGCLLLLARQASLTSRPAIIVKYREWHQKP